MVQSPPPGDLRPVSLDVPARSGPERARVALPLPVDECFTYLIPQSLAAQVAPGSRVQVRFGTRRLVGFVVGLEGAGPTEAEPSLRPIEEVLEPSPALGPDLLEFCRWAADYYFASWGELLACAVPASLRRARRETGRRMLRLTVEGRQEPDRLAAACGRSTRRRELLERLVGSAEGVCSSELPRDSARLLAPWLGDGLVEWKEAPPQSAPIRPVPASGPPLDLTGPQRTAVDALRTQLRAGGFAPVLLRGVTGSGKTEVYLRAAAEAVALGRSVLYLVPEIGLTPLLAQRLRAHFGDAVALLHSGLSRSERHREWLRIRRGEASVVLGARSALFAPVARLGLVVVDEEQDSSYKQDERPRYQARDLALVRGRMAGAVVVLGSATPSLESSLHAREGKYQLLQLPSRVEGRPLAHAEIVDMREEFRCRGEADPVSERLVELLRQGLKRGEQSVLLLNRRGYASFVLCRECGAMLSCPQCSVSLVFHRAARKLSCHYCGYGRGYPETCPACSGPRLTAGGEGTERLEERLLALLPGAGIVRLDRDTVRRRGEAERILTGFGRGEWDVLLGTQMVAKGHDFPRVTLVGVLGAEGTLGLPDFRAAERTFQLVTQVGGRSGRGESPGRVVIQTFQPDHYAIRHACAQDFEGFYAEEIRFRRLLHYPPFTVLVNVVVARRDAAAAERQAGALAESVSRAGGEHVRVLGPGPAPIARLRGQHRFQILLKARTRSRLAAALRDALLASERDGHPRRHVSVDVDPRTLL